MPRRRVFYNVGLSLFRYCEIRRQLERQLLTVPQRRGHSTSLRATWGSTRVGLEAEGARGNQGQHFLLWFLWERQGRVSRFRIS